MKKFTKVLSTVLALMMSVGSISVASLSASAAEENKIEVTSNVTDSVVYDYDENSTQFTVTYMLQSNYRVINAQAEVNYDSSVLRLADTTTIESISPVLSKRNYAGNIDLDNKVKFNSTSTTLYNFTQSAAFFTATFDIIGSGYTNVDLNIDVLTGTTAKTSSGIASATDVAFVNYDTVDNSNFKMTVAGEVTTPVTEGVTLKFAAPTVANRSFAWNDVSLYYTSAADISKATLLKMKATDEVYYAPEVGEAASTLLSPGAWTVYSITLTDEQVAAIDAAGKVGFCTADQTVNTASRTHFAGTRNVFMAGVDEYLDTYNTTKASVAKYDGYTFIIKTTAAGNGANKYYRGNWVSDFTTVKFAAPASNNRESAWDAVELYYGAKYSTSVTVPMVNTKETTKVSDLGDMTTLKAGRWYIYAVSLDAAQTEAVNKSTCVGFQKPGADNKTSASKSILLAKTDVYDGSYNAKARKLQDLEGQVFVVQAKSAANQLKTFVGEWQTEAKYTEGRDDTITIYFAAPKGTSATATWSTGVELFYGKTTVYTNTERLAMTKTNKTVKASVDGTNLTTLVSGNWDVYELTLTSEQISTIDNSNNVGFIKTDSYNRTSILQTKNITRASRLEGETSYSSAAETIEAFDGMTFIINGCQDTKNERTSYIGSWVLV